MTWARGRRGVALAAGAMVTAQIVLRAVLTFRSWWLEDDFAYIARISAPGFGPADLMKSYDSHLVPGTLALTWVITKLAPYHFSVAAALIILTLLLADLAVLRFLVVAFGWRWGILPPLALYLVSPFVVQATLWWTVGSHHFITHAVIALAMTSQVLYLRSGRTRHALAAVVWVAIGLVFYEKALLAIGGMLFLTLAYFTTGTLAQRLKQVWARYRFSVVANAVLGVTYLTLYWHYGLSVRPAAATSGQPISQLGPVAEVMALRSWIPGLFGGPLTWGDQIPNDPHPAADPPGWFILLACVAFVLVVREIARSRDNSLRALWLAGYLLATNIALVAVARTAMTGSMIAYQYRYLSELSVGSAFTLGLATLPLLGAVEIVAPKRPSRLLDQRRTAFAATAVVVALATVSTLTYAHQWSVGRQPAAGWFQHFIADAKKLPPRSPLANTVAPSNVALPFTYPDTEVMALIQPIRPDVVNGVVGSESLPMVLIDGHIGTMQITRVRTGVPAPVSDSCGYRVTADASAQVDLDGPVVLGGWWVQITYIATNDGSVTVSAGGTTYTAPVSAGLHRIFAAAGDQDFSHITIGPLQGPGQLCTHDVVVGRPATEDHEATP